MFSPYIHYWQPYRLSQIHAFRINLSYKPKDQSLTFWWKNIENWRFWKSQFFWVGYFDIFFQKIFFCFISIKTRHKLRERMDGTQLLLLSFFSSQQQPTQNIFWGSVVESQNNLITCGAQQLTWEVAQFTATMLACENGSFKIPTQLSHRHITSEPTFS